MDGVESGRRWKIKEEFVGDIKCKLSSLVWGCCVAIEQLTHRENILLHCWIVLLWSCHVEGLGWSVCLHAHLSRSYFYTPLCFHPGCSHGLQYLGYSPPFVHDYKIKVSWQLSVVSASDISLPSSLLAIFEQIKLSEKWRMNTAAITIRWICSSYHE